MKHSARKTMHTAAPTRREPAETRQTGNRTVRGGDSREFQQPQEGECLRNIQAGQPIRSVLSRQTEHMPVPVSALHESGCSAAVCSRGDSNFPFAVNCPSFHPSPLRHKTQHHPRKMTDGHCPCHSRHNGPDGPTRNQRSILSSIPGPSFSTARYFWMFSIPQM
jgi:hypothetical protein